MTTVRFVENQNPLYTHRHLDHIETYRAAYGSEYFSDDLISYQRAKVDEGRPNPRISPGAVLYEIYVGEHYVGDIVLVRNQMPAADGGLEVRYEIDLAIFQEFAGQGYGKLALREFLPFFTEQYEGLLEAIILNENPDRDKVDKLFTGAGFTYLEDLPGATGRVYVYGREHV